MGDEEDLPDGWRQIFRASQVDLSGYTSSQHWQGLAYCINWAIRQTFYDGHVPKVIINECIADQQPLSGSIRVRFSKRELVAHLLHHSNLGDVALPVHSRPRLAYSLRAALCAEEQEQSHAST